MVKCCITGKNWEISKAKSVYFLYILIVSTHNKAHTRGVDVGHDNAVYMHPQNEVSFLQGKQTFIVDKLAWLSLKKYGYGHICCKL